MLARIILQLTYLFSVRYYKCNLIGWPEVASCLKAHGEKKWSAGVDQHFRVVETLRTARAVAKRTRKDLARYPSSHKNVSRHEILSAAAERLRRDGIAAVSVRSVMSDAGLTHGAFYAHFGSRSDLVSHAVAFAAGSTLFRFRDVAASAHPANRLEAIVDAYLHEHHRENMHTGCAMSALAPEIAREDSNTRKRFMDGNLALIRMIADALPPGGSPSQRNDRARAIFGGLLGTLQMMRIATSDAEVERFRIAGRTAALLLARQFPDVLGR